MTTGTVKIPAGNCTVGDGMGGNGEPCYALQVILESVNKLDEKLDKKFDELSRNREEIARDQGSAREKIQTLQKFMDNHTEDHKWLWRALITAFLGLIGAYVIAFFKRG